MKTPQPVAYATGQPKALRRALLFLFFLLVVLGLWWLAQSLANPAGQLWRAALVVGSIIAAARGLKQHLDQDPRGLLRFDGEQWWYQPHAKGHAFSEQPVHLELIWDAQTLLLLRLHWDFAPEPSKKLAPLTLWLVGDISSHPWVALRRALLATARIIAPHANTV